MYIRYNNNSFGPEYVIDTFYSFLMLNVLEY